MHVNQVASELKGFSVHIKARAEQDIDPAEIMKRVYDASGAKYSVQQDRQVTKAPLVSTPQMESHTQNTKLSAASPITVPPTNIGSQKTSSPLLQNQNTHSVQNAKALYDFEPSESVEIRLVENEIVSNVTSFPDDPHWLKGTNSEGKSGLFPANYVEYITAKELYSNVGTRYTPITTTPKPLGAERQSAFSNLQGRISVSNQLPHSGRVSVSEQQEKPTEREVLQRTRIEREATERARVEKEATERARLEREAAERARLEREANERARLDREATERARLEKEATERARLEREATERARLEKEATERARLENEATERARLEQQEAAIIAAGLKKSTLNQTNITAIALYDYQPVEENEIALIENEIITDIHIFPEDDGWIQGVNSRGHVGLFPANYVQMQHHAAASDEKRALALYDYEPEESNELRLTEGDIITEIEFVSEEWWKGKCNNQVGLCTKI
jgi:hypothetical protein